MTEPGPVRFAEPGSTWWPVLWGPGFALLGALLDVLTGQLHLLAWLVAAVVLAGIAALWVVGRRRSRSVTLTADALVQGEETLPVARIAAVEEDEAPLGTRVLGGGWTAPRKLGEVALRLDDDALVIAWARDADGLREALTELVVAEPKPE